MTGLIDLLEDADPHGGPLGADADVFERGRAVEQTLRRLADEAPVVVAIDDLQWLDTISLRSLRYALRRLDNVAVSVLATERSTGRADRHRAGGSQRGARARSALAARPQHGRADRGRMHSPQPVLDRVYELSDGNPLFAIELARVLARQRRLPRGDAADAARHAGRADRRRHAAPADGAAHGRRPRSGHAGRRWPRRATTPGAGSLIADALADELLVCGEDGLIRFAHPLLASVILDGTNPIERMALHARLADVVADPDGRARHLALSCRRQDPSVAAELESAAERAARLGAIAVAAEFAAHSIRVTPSADADARGAAHARCGHVPGRRRRAGAGAGHDRRAARARCRRARRGSRRRRCACSSTSTTASSSSPGRSPRPATTSDGAGACSSSAAGSSAPIAAGWTMPSSSARRRCAIALAEGDEELEMLASATLSTTLGAGRATDRRADGARPRPRRAPGTATAGPVAAAVPGAPGDVGRAAGRGAAAVRGDAPRVLPAGHRVPTSVPAERPGVGRGGRRQPRRGGRADRRRTRRRARRRQPPSRRLARLPGRRWPTPTSGAAPTPSVSPTSCAGGRRTTISRRGA